MSGGPRGAQAASTATAAGTCVQATWRRRRGSCWDAQRSLPGPGCAHLYHAHPQARGVAEADEGAARRRVLIRPGRRHRHIRHILLCHAGIFDHLIIICKARWAGSVTSQLPAPTRAAVEWRPPPPPPHPTYAFNPGRRVPAGRADRTWRLLLLIFHRRLAAYAPHPRAQVLPYAPTPPLVACVAKV